MPAAGLAMAGVARAAGPTKITKIEFIRFRRDLRIRDVSPNWFWVRLHTDSGITGIGESYPGTEAHLGALKEIAPYLIGKDPTRIDQSNLKLSEKTLNVVKEVQRISEEVGKPMSQVAINWVRQQPKAQMIPILGARSKKQLKDNLGVLDWSLSDEQWKCLDEVSAIDMGFPH